jgi:hypothetical protein
MDKVKEGTVSQLTKQKDRTSDGIGSVVTAVRHSTQELREQQHDTIAEYVEEAAAQLERFSRTLKDKNVSQLLEDGQRFARRNPALFIGGSFVVGMLSARFFKSSRDRSGNDDGRERFARGGRDSSGDRLSQSAGNQFGRADVQRPPTGPRSYDPGRP